MNPRSARNVSKLLLIAYKLAELNQEFTPENLIRYKPPSKPRPGQDEEQWAAECKDYEQYVSVYLDYLEENNYKGLATIIDNDLLRYQNVLEQFATTGGPIFECLHTLVHSTVLRKADMLALAQSIEGKIDAVTKNRIYQAALNVKDAPYVLEFIARDLDTTQSILILLMRNNSLADHIIYDLIAEHPNASEEMLQQIFDHGNLTRNRARSLAKHPNTSASMLRDLVPYAVQAVIENDKTPDDVLLNIGHNYDYTYSLRELAWSKLRERGVHNEK